jgi:hypothetical protein
MPIASARVESWLPTDDAERLATYLEAVGGGLVPKPFMGGGRAGRDPPQQHHDLPDHQLRHAAGVGEGRVEHGDAAHPGRIQFHLVGADAEAAHQHQPVGSGDHRLGQVGAGADAEDVHAAQCGRQRLPIQGFGHFHDLRIAGTAQQRHGAGMHAFQQQDPDLVLAQRMRGHR